MTAPHTSAAPAIAMTPRPAAAGAPRTLFQKVWDAHLVRAATPSTPAVLYVDLHLVHEVTSAQAFAELRARGLRVRRPASTVATMDHSTPTTPQPHRPSGTPAGTVVALPVMADAQARAQLERLAENCAEFGVPSVGTL